MGFMGCGGYLQLAEMAGQCPKEIQLSKLDINKLLVEYVVSRASIRAINPNLPCKCTEMCGNASGKLCRGQGVVWISSLVGW